jgi:fatty acid-binding protein DegV
LAGDLLHIKPVFLGNNDTGKPELHEKVRGRHKAVKLMVDMLGDLVDSLENSVVGITHVHCLADAQHLGQLITERYNPEDIWISDMSATIGTYAGEGGLMVNV